MNQWMNGMGITQLHGISRHSIMKYMSSEEKQPFIDERDHALGKGWEKVFRIELQQMII